MKHFFSILLWCLATLSACQAQKDHLVLRGTIPGARDSMFISLYTKQEYREEVASGYIVNGKFELTGKLDRPTFCFLMLDNYEWWNRHGNKDESKLHYYETNFFVENGDLTFRTSHIDSLPLAFGKYNVLKEANYVVMGSVAQDAYAEYMKATLPLQARYRSAAWAYSDSKDIRDYQKSKEAEEQLHQAIFDFIGKRHHLDVNLLLADELLPDAFTYDSAYLDRLEELFAYSQDTCSRLRNFRETVRARRAFLQGTPIGDGKILTPKNEEVSLLPLLNKDGYTLIDFWASWCGPCRASFPHLMEMHKEYGNQVYFISISTDKKEEDWQKALREEQLPWGQYRVTDVWRSMLRSEYDLRSIPTFFLIDSQGRIIFTGHNSGELETRLKALNL